MNLRKHVSMKYAATVFFLGMFAAGTVAPAHAVLKAKWRTSTSQSPWVAEQQLTIANYSAQGTEIDIDTTVKYQTMGGWGGSPNESGVIGLHKLPQALQDSVMRAMYDTVNGCKFNMIRLPIGCSDFSISGYSLDDFPGDYTMDHVNIHRDSLVTLDFCKKALAVNPNIKVWGSPWSAPAWMKGNNNWSGGASYPSLECELHQDSTTLRAYALYFSKVVTLYKNYGLPFFALSFQNEPYTCQPFPSMIWSNGAKMLNFMKNYLGPRMRADHPDVELWTPTMNLDDTAKFSLLNDSYCASIITTVCYQYQGESVMPIIHRLHPNLRAYNTELHCGAGSNSWSYPQTDTWPEIKMGVSNGNSGAFHWNLLLCSVPNATTANLCGYSAVWGTGNWPQQPIISIDTAGKKIAYNTQFYMLKHLSYYIRPGSKVVKVSGQYDTNQITVKNPDGSLAIVTNNVNGSQPIAIRFGNQMVTATLPAQSFASFMIYDSSTTPSSIRNPQAASVSRFVSANKYFKISGDRFSLPSEFAGKTCLGSIYDINGRSVRNFALKGGDVSLSKDFGISQGVYVMHVKAIRD